ncbi:hypothetical protein BDZ45DRAFT_748195 [Acephala macrosclerotiorum]|nr:hypothetical protein BDZ45DRAFT_748195 [Acephala macrosclerotiorum]
MRSTRDCSKPELATSHKLLDFHKYSEPRFPDLEFPTSAVNSVGAGANSPHPLASNHRNSRTVDSTLPTMRPCDYDGQRAKISEYEFRAQQEEHRGPTRPLELPEPEGWWNRVREKFLNSNIVSLGVPIEESERVKNVDMGDLQIKWHKENDIIVTEDEVAVDEVGRIFLISQAHGFEVIWGKIITARILADLEKYVNRFNERYPPGDPNHDDKRFKENYSTDKAKVEELGWKCGIRHIAFRREEGQPHEIQSLTDETITGRHKFQAIDQFMQNLTQVKQTIGMSLSAILPEAYEKNRAIVENLSSTLAFKVLNTNVAATPHYDPGDYDDNMAGLHVWGDYDRQKGGELSVPVLGRSYRMYSDSILWLRSGNFLHLVRRSVIDGQRFSVVHATQTDIADFEAVKEPSTPKQKSDLQKDARKKEISRCPFCDEQFSVTGGLTLINKHL